MKKVLVLLIAALSSLSSGYAQVVSLKYGDVTKDELLMTVYKGDSSANAVVLNEDVNVYYEYANENFRVVTEFRRKVKILKKEGINNANIEIQHYSPVQASESRDRIESIEAFAYNWEGGEIQKEKMDKSLIREEQGNVAWKLLKFSIPSVKERTVIEYKYTVKSPFFHLIQDWAVQGSIPVANAHMKVSIPQYFIFNVEIRGAEQLKVDESFETKSFTILRPGLTTDQVTCNCRVLDFSIQDLKAVEAESHLWCMSDFIVRASFELQGTDFDGYRPFAKSWKDIDNILADETGFGDLLKMANPYKEELQEIMNKDLPERAEIQALFALVKSKIKWNKSYDLYGHNVKSAIQNGVGSNADINFVMLALLRDAGIKAYPVLLSRRSLGRLPETHASISKLNTFVVGIRSMEGEKLYLDGSADFGDINILPQELLVSKAREYGAPEESGWVDLAGIGKNHANLFIEASLSGDAMITGKCIFTFKGQYAANRRESYVKAGGSTGYLDKIQKDFGFTASDPQVLGIDSVSSVVMESFNFTRRAGSKGQLIYFPAMLVSHLSGNPFTKKERMFPVEFPFPYQYRINCRIKLPEGYEVKLSSKPVKLSLDQENSCQCSYFIQQNGDEMGISYSFTLNRIFYSHDEYPALQKMWETLMEKNQETIVLRKKR